LRKLLTSLNFIVISFILLTPVRAGKITYYSPDGEIITYSEYKEACKKRPEELLALKEIAKKIEILKPEIYKNPTLSSKVQPNDSGKKTLNTRSYRKKNYSSEKDKNPKNNELEQEKQLWAMERERLKRQFESEIPGLEYSTEPIEKPAKIEDPSEEWEKSQREKELRILLSRKCTPPLVKIYDNISNQVRCVHRVIANDAAKKDDDIEIIGP